MSRGPACGGREARPTAAPVPYDGVVRISIAVALVVSVARTAAAQPAGPPGTAVAEPSPDQELVVMKRPNPYLAVGGLVIGGTAYGGSIATSVVYLALIFPFQAAAGCDQPSSEPLQLAIPIAGPLMVADSQPDLRTLMYVDAGTQAVGLAMIGSAWLFKQEILVERQRAGVARRAPRFVLGGGPRGSTGLSLGGAF